MRNYDGTFHTSTSYSIPDSKYKFVIYLNHLIIFLKLESLDTKKNCDLASRCLLSGSPHSLLTGNGREFCNKVEEDLNAMWPVLKIVLGKEPNSCQKELILTLIT
jgi:hypothetical protein